MHQNTRIDDFLSNLNLRLRQSQECGRFVKFLLLSSSWVHGSLFHIEISSSTYLVYLVLIEVEMYCHFKSCNLWVYLHKQHVQCTSKLESCQFRNYCIKLFFWWNTYFNTILENAAYKKVKKLSFYYCVTRPVENFAIVKTSWIVQSLVSTSVALLILDVDFKSQSMNVRYSSCSSQKQNKICNWMTNVLIMDFD